MVVKRSWQIGACLGALGLLVGTASAAEPGYWKQQGDIEYWNKKLPPHGPASTKYVASDGSTTVETSIDKANTCKVRFIRTVRLLPSVGERLTSRTVNDFVWTPPPAVMIPGQVIPASGRVQVTEAIGDKVTHGPSDPGGGALYCHVERPRKEDGSPGGLVADVFAGINNGGQSRTIAHWEFTNPKCTIGKGAKGQTVYLLFEAQGAFCPENLRVATPYVWVEGEPPAPIPPVSLPPISVATTEPVVPPVPPTPDPTPPPEPAPVTQMTLQAGVRLVAAGQPVTVPVWLIQAAAANMNFNVTFDAGVVASAGAAVKGNLLDKSLFEAKTGEAGVVRVGFAQGKDLSGTGTVVQIPFKAVGKPGDKSVLRLEVVKAATASASNASVAVIHGEILIVGPDGLVPGDDNNDRVLTAGDALAALKMSVKLIPSKPNMDMDNDGQVTSNDAMLILQKVVGK